ncbi:protein angel homolog 1 isoform X2 [Myxocyprinus asiaticus]|uniref:protein angel homolog 1 isoform X2 n=1 Tax=Myxocyprinus asiaticus TaxID=70543 RepID=UPI002222B8F0|nr:protein angel homolog 1 isoform X2 [Myxocyprinus asiaticus]
MLIMIVTVMFYALYPLTRFISRVSELWQQAACVYINGKVCDAGGAPYRPLTEQQWNSTQNTAVIPNPERTESGNTQGVVQEEAVLDGSEVLDELEWRPQEELIHEDTLESLCYDHEFKPYVTPVQEEENAGVVGQREDECHQSEQTESLDNNGLPLVIQEVELAASVVRCLEESSQDCAQVINEFESHSKSEDMFAGFNEDAYTSPLDVCADVSNLSLDPTADDHSNVEASDSCVETGSTEYDDGEKDSSVPERDTHPSACSFDVLLGFDCDAGNAASFSNSSPVFHLAAFLADAEHVQMPVEPVGWHFPVGAGLSQMCYCPYVQFPGVSYYPAFQDNNNIEVMWRVWEDLSKTHADACADPASVFEFSVMSYNVLSQDLLEMNRELYTHCTEDVLVWENRLQTILEELKTWEPDVICLQEVQENHFLEQMFPVLTQMGYTCIYKRRTGTKTDGCAVCYHGDRFTQLSVNLLEFHRSDCELLDRDNVAIVLLLQPITEQDAALRPICVANTHLLFNPRRGDVKLAQLAILFAEIDMMMKQCKSEGRSCEVILCGDLNCLPNTPLWQFITTGQLYYHGLPAWMVSGQIDLSNKFHHRRLFAPLWPVSLGINENCQYRTQSDTQVKGSGKLQYSHDFLRQLRYCQMACVRPPDLEFIPGVTDNTPDVEEIQMFSPKFRHSLYHSLRLTSAYSHIHPDTQSSAVTTLNSEGGAMVDYIFYSTQTNYCGGCTESDGGLKLIGRLSLLPESELWSLKGLPNETFPSDHLSLLVRFQFC